MSRAVIALAIESGIAPSQWWAEDERDLATALDIMARERSQQNAQARRDDEGRVMGGGG